MKIITETKSGFDLSCGPYGATRIGIEHNGVIICWGQWDGTGTYVKRDGTDEVLRELVRCYQLKHTEPAHD